VRRGAWAIGGLAACAIAAGIAWRATRPRVEEDCDAILVRTRDPRACVHEMPEWAGEIDVELEHAENALLIATAIDPDAAARDAAARALVERTGSVASAWRVGAYEVALDAERADTSADELELLLRSAGALGEYDRARALLERHPSSRSAASAPADPTVAALQAALPRLDPDGRTLWSCLLDDPAGLARPDSLPSLLLVACGLPPLDPGPDWMVPPAVLEIDLGRRPPAELASMEPPPSPSALLLAAARQIRERPDADAATVRGWLGASDAPTWPLDAESELCESPDVLMGGAWGESRSRPSLAASVETLSSAADRLIALADGASPADAPALRRAAWWLFVEAAARELRRARGEDAGALLDRALPLTPAPPELSRCMVPGLVLTGRAETALELVRRSDPPDALLESAALAELGRLDEAADAALVALARADGIGLLDWHAAALALRADREVPADVSRVAHPVLELVDAARGSEDDRTLARVRVAREGAGEPTAVAAYVLGRLAEAADAEVWVDACVPAGGPYRAWARARAARWRGDDAAADRWESLRRRHLEVARDSAHTIVMTTVYAPPPYSTIVR
jgi:hypothetical protein